MTVTVESPLRDELFRNGYVVVRDVIDQIKVLQPVLEEYAGVLDKLATELARKGRSAAPTPSCRSRRDSSGSPRRADLLTHNTSTSPFLRTTSEPIPPFTWAMQCSTC